MHNLFYLLYFFFGEIVKQSFCKISNKKALPIGELARQRLSAS